MRAGNFVLLVAALLAASPTLMAAEAAAPRPPALFAVLDADGDGRLTAQELQAAREQQVVRFDADGDGRLSAAEYQAWWLAAAQPRLARQFEADDGDKNGEITLEELIERSTALLRRRDADGDGALTVQEWRARRSKLGSGPV